MTQSHADIARVRNGLYRPPRFTIIDKPSDLTVALAFDGAWIR